MALLLETTLGDLVIDLDIDGSPEICKNVLKLAAARYYTTSLIYNVQPNRFCQLGDPQGDGSGGSSIYGLLAALSSSSDPVQMNTEVLNSQQRFLKSSTGRALTEEECREKGRVVATEMKGIPNTIGSQLLITTCEGQDMALDGFRSVEAADSSSSLERQVFRSVGIVREDDDNVLDKIASSYCDSDGRPYADIRIIRALVIDDPFDDPPGMDKLLQMRGVVTDVDDNITASPDPQRPPEEMVEIRIPADQIDPLTGEEDLEKMKKQEDELLKREDKSRAVVLEMLGDLPDADIQAPEDVLFVCKLNPVTEDEDLELIFSRFDEKVKAEIIRDPDTGSSLQYAFVEFSSKEQATEAYFKMNNALVDDRRIKVDFSQSVAKVWNKYTQRRRNPSGNRSNQAMPRNPFADGRPESRPNNGNRRQERHQERRNVDHPDMDRRSHRNDRDGRGREHASGVQQRSFQEVDQFGRQRNWADQPNRGKGFQAEEHHGGREDHRPDDNRRHHRRSRSRSSSPSDRHRRGSSSREGHRRKHHRHHKSKKHHKEHRRDRSRERSSSPRRSKRRYSDESEDSRHNPDNGKRHGSRGDYRESNKADESDRKQTGRHGESGTRRKDSHESSRRRDRSRNHRSRSRSPSSIDDRRRHHREEGDRTRQDDSHGDDRIRSRSHKKRERGDREHRRHSKDDRKRHRRD